MIRLHVIQAEYGDCFILVSKLDKDSMNVLIDGGPYVTELLYEIVVENRPKPESKGSVGFEPPRNLSIIKRIVEEKRKKGEITENEGNKILGAILSQPSQGSIP